MPLASQITLQNSQPQFALINISLQKSNCINKSAAYTLRNSDNKECGQSEQLDPIKPIFGANEKNYHKFLKLGPKVQIPNYKYNQRKNTSLFAQNRFRIH